MVSLLTYLLQHFLPLPVGRALFLTGLNQFGGSDLCSSLDLQSLHGAWHTASIQYVFAMVNCNTCKGIQMIKVQRTSRPKELSDHGV